MNNDEFFNRVSSFYDQMINFKAAIERRIKFYSKFDLSGKALDLGCGTGLDSIALAKLGFDVTACDQSPEMISKAKLNTAKENVLVNFICTPIESAFENISDRFDFVISMGNTLANISKPSLSTFLTNLLNHLNSESQIIFHVINFDLLPQSGLYPINKFENDFVLIERFYEIKNQEILFKIVFIDKQKEYKSDFATQIFPHTKDIWDKLLSGKNFKISYFGSMKMDEFQSESSKDLFIILKTVV